MNINDIVNWNQEGDSMKSYAHFYIEYFMVRQKHVNMIGWEIMDFTIFGTSPLELLAQPCLTYLG